MISFPICYPADLSAYFKEIRDKHPVLLIITYPDRYNECNILAGQTLLLTIRKSKVNQYQKFVDKHNESIMQTEIKTKFPQIVNTVLPKKILETIVNEGGNYNCYDNKRLMDFDVDDFAGFVYDNTDSTDDLVMECPVIKAIFNNTFNAHNLSVGSGMNKNEFFNKFGSVRSALYDIWWQIRKDSGLSVLAQQFGKSNV